mgnify:CR=1 FL=1
MQILFLKKWRIETSLFFCQEPSFVKERERLTHTLLEYQEINSAWLQ